MHMSKVVIIELAFEFKVNIQINMCNQVCHSLTQDVHRIINSISGTCRIPLKQSNRMVSSNHSITDTIIELTDASIGHVQVIRLGLYLC